MLGSAPSPSSSSREGVLDPRKNVGLVKENLYSLGPTLDSSKRDGFCSMSTSACSASVGIGAFQYSTPSTPQATDCGTQCSSPLQRSARTTIAEDLDLERGSTESLVRRLDSSCTVSGCKQMFDPDGIPFWLHLETNEVSWTLPNQDWTASWDKFGNCFWVNKDGYMVPRDNRVRSCNAETQCDGIFEEESDEQQIQRFSTVGIVSNIAEFVERMLSKMLSHFIIRPK